LRDTEVGGKVGALVVLTDVTGLRQVDRVRKDFVANVSHELRTPITTVKGFAETLTDGTAHDPGDVSRFLEIIGSHADRMEKIIEDLLTLSRLELDGGRQAMDLDRVDLSDPVRRAVDACRPGAERKGITIETSLRSGVTIDADPHLLEQALVNLIDNAVKYSGDGSRVRVGCEEKAGGVVISVEDEGCGIAGEHLSRIFERFYRVDKARSRRLGGTGLGLAIVKHVAQIHGGRVDVRSTPGRGSVFSIHFPGNG
jgi:two-component system phosphate regulon sensor histidine kinase PhoR